MFGEKILLYTPFLKWYFEHGLIITKFYEAIEYNKNVFSDIFSTFLKVDFLYKVLLSSRA